MAVVKRAARASGTDDPQLTLNKHHEPNPGVSTWQVGVPTTYVIEVSHAALGPGSNISVTDTLPPGFVFINGTCTATLGATCQNLTPPPPTSGVLTIPARTTPQGWNIEIRITGYFKTSGPKNNLAEARAGSLSVGNATSHDPVDVPADPLPADIKVEKSASPASAAFPAHLHCTVRVTNNTATPVNLGGILKINNWKCPAVSRG